jgi:hypothetical protein
VVTSTDRSRTVNPMATREHAFHVGDRALYRFGPTDVPAEVIEERGPVGYHGARLVRIRLALTDADPVELTIPEADLRPHHSAA